MVSICEVTGVYTVAISFQIIFRITFLHFPFVLLQSDMEYLQYHLTTVKDIELLTGLRFFRNVYIRDRVMLQTVQATAVWDLPAERASTRKVNNRIGKSDNIPVEEGNTE